MKIERTPGELKVELRSAGGGRFFGAAFLSIWLAGWAVGEAFALWIVGAGAWSLVTGAPMTAGAETLDLGPALAVGLFLLLWLSIWTFGGFAAGAELLRLLFGKDTLIARRDGLEIVHRYGPFQSKKFIPRAELRSIRCMGVTRALLASTAGNTVDLTKLGRPENRAELAEALIQEFQLVEKSAPAALPKAWREIKSVEGETVLVRDPAMRRKQAAVTLLVALPVAATAVILIAQTIRNSSLGALAALVTAFALALVYGAARLGFTRDEWKIQPGKLTLQRRSPNKVTTKFTGASLELRLTSDGDGDTSYQLVALTDSSVVLAPRESRSQMRSIQSHATDPVEVRSLGEWLAARARLPFNDQTTPQAQAAVVEKLHEQLAGSGRIGRAMSGLLKRATPFRPRT